MKIYDDRTYDQRNTYVGTHINPYRWSAHTIYIESHANKDEQWIRVEFGVAEARSLVQKLNAAIRMVDPPKPRKPKAE